MQPQPQLGKGGLTTAVVVGDRGQILHLIEFLRKLDRATRAAGSALRLPAPQQQQAPAALDASPKKAASYPQSRPPPSGGLDTPFLPISKSLAEGGLTGAPASGPARIPDMIPVQMLQGDDAPTCNVRPPHLPPLGCEAEAEAWDPVVVSKSGNRSHWPPAARARAAAEALGRSGTPPQQPAVGDSEKPGGAMTASRGDPGTPSLRDAGAAGGRHGTAAAPNGAGHVPSLTNAPVTAASVTAPRPSVPPPDTPKPTASASVGGPSLSPLSAASSMGVRAPVAISAAVRPPDTAPSAPVVRDAFPEVNGGPVAPEMWATAPCNHVQAASVARGS